MCDVGVPSKDELLALVLCTRRASAGPSWTPGFWFRAPLPAGLRTLQENREAAPSHPVLASGPQRTLAVQNTFSHLQGAKNPS